MLRTSGPIQCQNLIGAVSEPPKLAARSSRRLPQVLRPPGRHSRRRIHKLSPSPRPSERSRPARRAPAPVPTSFVHRYAAAPPKNVGSSTHGMSAASCQPTRLERHDTPSALRAPFGKAQRGQLGKGLERDSRSKPPAFGKAFAKLNSLK